jgi:hypothetical protein
MGQEPHNQTAASRQKLLVFVVVALAAVLAGVTSLVILYLAQTPRLMIVETVDGSGRRIGLPRPMIIPAPEVVSRSGLLQLRPNVERFLASRARFTSLLIFTPDGMRGCGLQSIGGKASISVTLDTRTEASKERAVRSLFANRGVVPAEDYLAANGGVPNATRILEYPLPSHPEQATALCRQVLQKVHAISDVEGLHFTHQEQN